NFRQVVSAKEGSEFVRTEYELTKDMPPMMLVDYAAKRPRVVGLIPQKEELLTIPLKSLSNDQILELNRMITEPIRQTLQSWSEPGIEAVSEMKLQLGIS